MVNNFFLLFCSGAVVYCFYQWGYFFLILHIYIYKFFVLCVLISKYRIFFLIFFFWLTLFYLSVGTVPAFADGWYYILNVKICKHWALLPILSRFYGKSKGREN